MGFQKGFKIYKTSVQAGNFVCCVLEGVSKSKREEKKKMFLMVDSEIDMQMVDSENE